MSKLKNEIYILRDENRRLHNSLEMNRKVCDRYYSALVEILILSSLSPVINDIARDAISNTGTNGIFKITKEIK